MLELNQARSARKTLRDVLAQIDVNEVYATDPQRAYIAGAAEALDALGEDPTLKEASGNS